MLNLSKSLITACSMVALLAVLVPAEVMAQSAVPEGYSSLDVRPPEAASELNRHLARLANNPRDINALIGAGNAAIDLEDPRAATGFFARAEGIDPDDGRVKAGLGRAMVQMENPRDALRLFEEAIRRGTSERLFLVDRGLAFDLTGDPARAQRDYQAAMMISPNNDELIRRYAVSLGISGKWAEAEKMLEPLLYRNDRSAWRNRAFILAMNGQHERARTITQSVMPKPLADSIQPYMDRIANLTPAQRAAAVHFGRFPAGALQMAAAPTVSQRADAGLIPKGKPLGSTGQKPPSASERRRAEREAKARVQAEQAAARQRTASQTRQERLAKREQTEKEALAQRLAKAGYPVVPEPKRIGERVNRRLNPRIAPVVAVAEPPKPVDLPAPIAAAGTAQSSRVPDVAAASPVQTPQVATSIPTPPVAVSPAMVQQQPVAARVATSPQPLPAASAAVAVPQPGFVSIPADGAQGGTATSTLQPTGLIGPVDPVPQPLPSQSALSQTVPSQIATAAVTTTPATVPISAEPTSAETFSLSDIISSIEVPEQEKQPTVAPVSLAEVAVLQAQMRKAEEEKAALAAAEKAKKDAAAKAKAEAEAKKKADAEAAEKREKAKHPARVWVQIATGRDKKALAFDMRNFRKKYGDVLKGEDAFTSAWGSTNRLVIGPFASLAKAKTFVSEFRKAGGDGFAWESSLGLEVTPLAGGS